MDLARREQVLHEIDETDLSVMQSTTTSRHLAAERAHHSRRGHAPQISISDTDHHVTEAIGGMYGSDDEEYAGSPSRPTSRPLSYLSSPKEAYDSTPNTFFETKRSSPPRTPLGHTMSNERVPPNIPIGSPKALGRSESLGSENGPMSPPPLHRSSSSETAVQQFPLNDIDYESSPAAVAQELSNLQAIRRMSMNVDTADPDLPTFNTGFGVPAAAPSHSADEDDASRLFWVPARLHPELAPKEFKTFVEDRVDRMKRRSGGDDSLSPGGLDRQGSGGLKRKKSMLSRQIDTGRGYEDGAERLERKRSEVSPYEPSATDNLSELETLVNDPSNLIRKLSIDTTRKSHDSGVEVSGTDDRPILPPLGIGLKRSTRTAYRRGSLRKGERIPFSKRAMGRQADNEADDSPVASPIQPPPDEQGFMLKRVQTEPMAVQPPAPEPTENFSRPSRSKRPGLGQSSSTENLVLPPRSPPPPEEEPEKAPNSVRPQFHSRIASNGRTTAALPGSNAPVPQIIETPPPPAADRSTINKFILPERRSSHQPPPPSHSPSLGPRGAPHLQGAHARHAPGTPRAQPSSTLDDISSHPSPLPGSGSSRTDDLTLVPTFNDKKIDKKDGNRKTSWGWLLGNDEKDREKEREKDRDKEHKERKEEKEREKEREKQKEKEEKEKEALRKPKISSKLARAPDKTRLDVLQTSIDGGGSRGRESLVLDREAFKLEEERKKESTRKSAEPAKKEKDGILSAFFGGKRKGGEETTGKKRQPNRGLSPEPPPRILKPDIDYNWTRFSILEERAIYRMAHIKLANPKRALYSQVLLSNFMYSYLAKVQQMHPQMQIPGAQKPTQSRSQPAKKEEKQAAEFTQYQRWQEQQTRKDPTQAVGEQAAEKGSLQTRGGLEEGAMYDHRTSIQQQALQRMSSNGGTYDSQGYSDHGHTYDGERQWDEGDMFDGL